MLLVFVGLTLAAAAVATAAICLLHGMPVRELFTRRPLRYGTVMIGVPAVVGGVLARLATDSWMLAAAGAALVAIPPLLWVNRSRRQAARLANMSDAEIDKMVTDLEARRPAEGESSMAFEIDAVTVARHFTFVGRLDAAARTLLLLDWDRIEGAVMYEAASTLAFCYIRSGLVTQAREVLARAEGKLLDQGDPERLEVLDARLLVHEGQAATAHARLGRLEEIVTRLPELRADVLVLKAHAIADRGDHDGAIAVIADLRQERGDEAFLLLSRPDGPASEIAAQLASRSAYR